MHQHLLHVDPDTKTLTPTHTYDHFPRELRARVVDKANVEVELFGVKTQVFAGPELLFSCGSRDGQTSVRYELVDEAHRSGEVFLVYRKYDVSRRKLERSGLVLPGRG